MKKFFIQLVIGIAIVFAPKITAQASPQAFIIDLPDYIYVGQSMIINTYPILEDPITVFTLATQQNVLVGGGLPNPTVHTLASITGGNYLTTSAPHPALGRTLEYGYIIISGRTEHFQAMHKIEIRPINNLEVVQPNVTMGLSSLNHQFRAYGRNYNNSRITNNLANLTNLFWSVTNPLAASVSNDGLVTLTPLLGSWANGDTFNVEAEFEVPRSARERNPIYWHGPKSLEFLKEYNLIDIEYIMENIEPPRFPLETTLNTNSLFTGYQRSIWEFLEDKDLNSILMPGFEFDFSLASPSRFNQFNTNNTINNAIKQEIFNYSRIVSSYPSMINVEVGGFNLSFNKRWHFTFIVEYVGRDEIGNIILNGDGTPEYVIGRIELNDSIPNYIISSTLHPYGNFLDYRPATVWSLRSFDHPPFFTTHVFQPSNGRWTVPLNTSIRKPAP
ncbi:MAG: hypothetical protein FWF50_06630 [Defluviitaleaceae bacterium]|nr:hypothetical protein [Defluviitaleaceae bacterium]